MSSLAEIVADGKELCAAVVDVEPDRAPDILVNAALVGYARQHGPRLLAVAEAAVEMRRIYGKLASLHSVEAGIPTWDVDADGELVQTGRTPDIDKPDCEHCRVLAAFDAAAGGQP